MFEKIERWYHLGLWTAAMVQDAADRGVITQQQFEKITSWEELL